MPPNYVDFGSKQTFIPPYLATGAKVYGFVLPADPAALQALVDKCLNQPRGGDTRYRPLFPIVLLSFADIERLNSIDPPDCDVGWLPERDVAFWVPLMEVKQELGMEVVQSIAFFQPLLFVDSPQALLTGREVQGFHKEYARIRMSRDQSNPEPLDVTTNVFPTYSPDTRIEERQILSVQRVAGGAPATRPVKTLEELLVALWKELQQNGYQLPVPGLKFLFDLYQELTKEEVPCVFLKQFRDVHDGSKACYQAINSVAMRVTRFDGGGLLPGLYQLALEDFASHPIKRELGIAGDGDLPLLGAYVDFEFRIEKGSVLWEATA